MKQKIDFDNKVDDEEIESRYILWHHPYKLLFKIDPIEMKYELLNIESVYLAYCNISNNKILWKNGFESRIFYSISSNDFCGSMEIPQIFLWKQTDYEDANNFISCYYQDNVYEFYIIYEHGAPKTSCRKFDLSRLEWKQLSFINKDIGVRSCVGYKNKIIITGKWNTHLWIYDLDLDSYSETPLNFGTYTYKFLFRKNSEIFLFDLYSRLVYINEENIYDWNIFCSLNLEGLCIEKNYRWAANYAYWEGILYFLLKNQVYSFDFNEEALQLKSDIWDEDYYNSLDIIDYD